MSVSRRIGIRLLILLLGSGAIGCLLISYKASLTVWLLTEAVMLYLAWAGTGAIALSVVSTLGILWSATLFHHEAEFLVWLRLPLTPAQYWATELLFNWLIGMVLIFKIAFANQWLCTRGWHQAKTFCWLAIVTSFGLSLVQLVNMLLPFPLYE